MAADANCSYVVAASPLATSPKAVPMSATTRAIMVLVKGTVRTEARKALCFRDLFQCFR